MKLLLLCLGLTLVFAHHEENHDVVTSNFDTSKISGEWYTILLSSDVKEKIEENGSLRLFVENIEALDNSSLLVKCHKEIYGTCAEFNFVCEETEEEGIYSVPYDGYNTFHIVEGAYDEYLVFYILNSKDENKTQVMVFVARNPDTNLELKKRFEELGEDRGIPKENVLDLTNANPCSHVRGS